MKKLCLLVAFLVTTFLTAQTYSVDNKPNAKADFDNLQTAINTVAAGSTLLVQGSTSSYGSLTIEKKITIKGTGYFLGENPSTQSNFSSSKVSSISFKAGSSGSIISGLYSSSVFRIYGESDLSFFRNRLLSIETMSGVSSNNVVSQNFIAGRISPNCSSNCHGSISMSNSVISGNYIGNSGHVKGVNLTLTNNVFNSGASFTSSVSYTCNAGIKGSTIINNIFRGLNTIPANKYNYSNTDCENKVNNNIFYHSTVTSAIIDDNDNKLTSQDPFIESSDASYTLDGKYKLKVGSIAKGAGVDGVDCGMFYEDSSGKDIGYKLSGLPDIPHIYEFNVPTTSNSSGIQVNVKVKSN